MVVVLNGLLTSNVQRKSSQIAAAASGSLGQNLGTIAFGPQSQATLITTTGYPCLSHSPLYHPAMRLPSIHSLRLILLGAALGNPYLHRLLLSHILPPAHLPYSPHHAVMFYLVCLTLAVAGYAEGSEALAKQVRGKSSRGTDSQRATPKGGQLRRLRPQLESSKRAYYQLFTWRCRDKRND